MNTIIDLTIKEDLNKKIPSYKTCGHLVFSSVQFDFVQLNFENVIMFFSRLIIEKLFQVIFKYELKKIIFHGLVKDCGKLTSSHKLITSVASFRLGEPFKSLSQVFCIQYISNFVQGKFRLYCKIMLLFNNNHSVTLAQRIECPQ